MAERPGNSMASDQGLPDGWVIVEQSPASPSIDNSHHQTSGESLPLFGAGTAISSGSKAATAATDLAGRLHFNPSTALESFSLNQPQRILNGVSVSASNPLRPASTMET